MSATVTSIKIKVERESNMGLIDRFHNDAEDIAESRRHIEAMGLDLIDKEGVNWLKFVALLTHLRDAEKINRGLALSLREAELERVL